MAHSQTKKQEQLPEVTANEEEEGIDTHPLQSPGQHISPCPCPQFLHSWEWPRHGTLAPHPTGRNSLAPAADCMARVCMHDTCMPLCDLIESRMIFHFPRPFLHFPFPCALQHKTLQLQRAHSVAAKGNAASKLRGNLCTARALRATFRICSPGRAPKHTPWKRP